MTTTATAQGERRSTATGGAPPRRRRSTSVSRARPSGRVLAYAFAILSIVISLFPFYLMLVTSLLPPTEFRAGNVTLIPSTLSFEHYETAFGEDLFLTNLKNSVLITVSAVLVTTVLAFLAAAAMGRFNFRGRTIYLVTLLIAQMIPIGALIIPMFLLMRDLNRVDQLSTVAMVYVVFNLPFAIWVMRSFVISIPPELEEQAMVDGCSRVGAFWRVLLPLVVPGLIATAVYAFIQSWSELVIALVMLQTDTNQTLPVWIASFTTPRGTDWGGLMAGSVIFTIPPMIMFIFVYRKIVTGLAAGAVKG